MRQWIIFFLFALFFSASGSAFAEPCEGDFDHDCDVDGSDLVALISFSEIDIDVFAENFGRLDCPPVIYITPNTQNISAEMGTTSFTVSNIGSGSLYWTATVISGNSWLTITSGSNGIDGGIINCAYTQNTGMQRTGIIRVQSSEGQQDVEVIQAEYETVSDNVKVDFNGDGKADIYLRNTYTGEHASWLLSSESGLVENVSFETVPPSTGMIMLGMKDFNGDQKTDMLWYNSQSGAISAWILDGNTILEKINYGVEPLSSKRSIIDLPDLNGDKKTDILWYDVNDGTISAWLLNGDGIIRKVIYGSESPTSGCSIMATNDFNGDSKEDLLWYDINTGAIYAWLLGENGVIKKTTYGTVMPNAGQTILGIGNFNGADGADLLWYDTETGDIYAWLLNGNGIVQNKTYGNDSTDSKRLIIGINDFNSDGATDLLVSDGSNGNIYIWTLNEGQFRKFFIKQFLPGSNETLIGFDDFDGNGTIDFLWHNPFNRRVTSWQLDFDYTVEEVFRGTMTQNSMWMLNIPGSRESSNKHGVKTDFNGDGKADLLLRNAFTGEISAWLTNGTQISQELTYSTVDPSTKWFPLSSGDVNGDGHTDLLWFNGDSGEIKAWVMSGNTILKQTSYGTVPPNSGKSVIAINDFNGDGCTDLLWYDTQNSTISGWLLNGEGIVSQPTYGTLSLDSGWILKGIADFNGDNSADLLWHNSYTNVIRVDFLAGNAFIGYKEYGYTENNEVFLGIGDFNADGYSDLLWYNTLTGSVFATLLNAYGMFSIPNYGTVLPDSGWTLTAIDDFDGDSCDDLLWYNRYSGEVLSWTIWGDYNLGFSLYDTVTPNSGWIIAGFDDFNGDNVVDFLWQNILTNQTKTWLNYGPYYGSGLYLEYAFNNIESGSIWQLIAPK